MSRFFLHLINIFFVVTFATLCVSSGDPEIKITISNNYLNETDTKVNKIVGGAVAKAHQFPYQVSLRTFSNSKHFCGGAIVGQRWILTAAHCFIGGERAHQIYATVGANDLYDGIHHYVSRIIQHPYFSLDKVLNDIALVTVKTPFTYDTTIKAIPIGTAYMVGGESAYVTGWGRTYENGPVTSTLHYTNVRIESNANCINTYRYHPEKSLAQQITNNNLCTTVVKGKGFCSGDSGGPLASNGYLVGIVSWSPYGCTYTGYPDVYTRVSVYHNWITSTMANSYFQ